MHAYITPRWVQAEFIARGMRSREEAHRTGGFVDADTVIEQSKHILDAARNRISKTQV